MQDHDGAKAQAEQVFFEDPALDRAFGVVMALATEVHVQRDRLAALERLLEQHGLLDRAALDAEPDEAERQRGAAERQAFVEGLMASLLGTQQARGASEGSHSLKQGPSKGQDDG